MVTSSIARTTSERVKLTLLLCLIASAVLVTLRLFSATSPLLICFVIGIIAGIGAFSLTDTRKVYYLLVAALPLEATLVVEAGFTITIAYMLIPLVIVAMLIRHENVPTGYTESKIALAYLLVCAVSVGVAFLVQQPDFRAAGIMSMRASSLRPIVQFGLIGMHVAFFLLVLRFAQSEALLIKSLKLYMAIAVVLSAIGIYQTAAVMLDLPLKDFTFAVGSVEQQTARYGETRFYETLIANFAPRGTFRESLHFSHYLNSVVPIFLVLFLYRKRLPGRWKFRLPVALSLLPAAALFLTLSRSGWVACVAGLLFLALFLPRHQTVKVSAVLLLSLVGIVAIFESSGYFEETTSVFELISMRMDSDILLIDPRIEQGAVLLSTWQQHPILGVGIGNYGVFAAAALGTPLLISANSVFLSALVENGIAGFLLLTSLPAVFLYKVWRFAPRARELAAYPYLIGIAAGVFAMTAQYFTFGDRPGLYYLFLLATGFAFLHLLKRTAN